MSETTCSRASVVSVSTSRVAAAHPIRHGRNMLWQRQVQDISETTQTGVIAMPALSPDVGAQLLKATRSRDLDEAFEKVLTEYLELKVGALRQTTDRLEEKWGMSFSEFKRRLGEDDLPDGAYTQEVEEDFWEWEEAETLKAHYEQVQKEWT